MAEERKIKTRQDLVNEIKMCGQSIIDNADSILGDEKYFLKIAVQFVVQRNADSVATVCTSKEFIPEQYIDNMANQAVEKKTKTTKKTTAKKSTTKNGGKK